MNDAAETSTSDLAHLTDSPPGLIKVGPQSTEQVERRAQVVAEHGSAEAVRQPCERETALRAAVRLYVLSTDVAGMPGGSLLGWNGSEEIGVPFVVAEAIAAALPMPRTPREAWAEYGYWRKRRADRAALDADAVPPIWILARQALLEDALDTVPGPTFEDAQARLAWLEYAVGTNGRASRDLTCLSQLSADIAALAVVASAGSADIAIQPAGRSASIPAVLPAAIPDDQTSGLPVRRTNAEKRSAVLALLGQDLTDREIARRAGVSPQHVGNIRRGA